MGARPDGLAGRLRQDSGGRRVGNCAELMCLSGGRLQVDQEVLELELRGGVAAANERGGGKVGVGARAKKVGKKSVLKECGIDLTAEAELNKLDPMIGRDKEVRVPPPPTPQHTHN